MTDFNSLFPTRNSINAAGQIRSKPENFIVIEHNNIEFSEQGEHLWFKLKKINSNTAWVATQIASACKVPARQVGYAGLKDRHAITHQWFSVQLPKVRDLNLIKAKLPEEITVIEQHWHQNKLKTGQLKFNEFQLIVDQLTGDKESIEKNIEIVQKEGVPNYFGPQRFGHNMDNISKAQDWFSGKTKVNNKKLRSILISTARSHIFNHIVSTRIKNNCWNHLLSGDVLQLDGSHSWFPESKANKQEIIERLAAFDIHLTAALWGEDEVQSTEKCAELEQQIASQYPIYLDGFANYRVQQDRRAIRVVPQNLTYQITDQQLKINFNLSPGAYATGVLREIINITEPEHGNN